MSTFSVLIDSFQFNHGRTLAVLDRVEKMDDPEKALVWRPGEGRAHVGWQLMHVGITEDIFASERLMPSKSGLFTDLWPRFRGGSTPDDKVPSPAEIRDVLTRSRDSLLDTLSNFGEGDLSMIPEALKERGLTLLQVLHIIAWHEAHHQGQAHLTLNLFEAAQ